MKYALVFLGVILAVGIVITVVGMCTARDHETSMTRAYNAPVKAVYDLVRNYEEYPKWRTGVKSMTRDGAARYVEESAHGKIPYQIVEELADTRLVSRIDDANFYNCGDVHTTSSRISFVKTAYATPRPLLEATILKRGWISCDPDCCTGAGTFTGTTY